MPWRPCKPNRDDWINALGEAGTVALMGAAVALSITLLVVLFS